jgi:hypothetical protein
MGNVSSVPVFPRIQNGTAQTLTPIAGSNRLTGYSYDASGNLTSDGTNSLVWDAANRMVNYASGGVKHEYDGNGLRVRRTVPTSGSDLAYVFSGTQPLAEYNAGAAATNPNVEYVYLGGQLIASKSGAAYTFYVRDQLSVRQVLTDSTSGTTVTEQGHLPFGENWYPSGNTNKWTFTSYERDAVSGDDYAQARRYQYAYGRFSLCLAKMSSGRRMGAISDFGSCIGVGLWSRKAPR